MGDQFQRDPTGNGMGDLASFEADMEGIKDLASAQAREAISEKRNSNLKPTSASLVDEISPDLRTKAKDNVPLADSLAQENKIGQVALTELEESRHVAQSEHTQHAKNTREQFADKIAAETKSKVTEMDEVFSREFSSSARVEARQDEILDEEYISRVSEKTREVVSSNPELSQEERAEALVVCVSSSVNEEYHQAHLENKEKQQVVNAQQKENLKKQEESIQQLQDIVNQMAESQKKEAEPTNFVEQPVDYMESLFGTDSVDGLGGNSEPDSIFSENPYVVKNYVELPPEQQEQAMAEALSKEKEKLESTIAKLKKDWQEYRAVGRSLSVEAKEIKQRIRDSKEAVRNVLQRLRDLETGKEEIDLELLQALEHAEEHFDAIFDKLSRVESDVHEVYEMLWKQHFKDVPLFGGFEAPEEEKEKKDGDAPEIYRRKDWHLKMAEALDAAAAALARAEAVEDKEQALELQKAQEKLDEVKKIMFKNLGRYTWEDLDRIMDSFTEMHGFGKFRWQIKKMMEKDTAL